MDAKILAPASPKTDGQRKTLVTGATGFLGSALMRQLVDRGENIRVLVRGAVPDLVAEPNIEVMYGDLGDPDAVDRAVRGMDLVYHVASAMSGGRAAFESGTILGTRHIVAACLRHQVKRLVYVSSIIVLDHAGHKEGTVVDETYVEEPYPELRGMYTRAKLDAERTVKNAIRNQGLPAVILRPGQIVGRGSHKFAPAGTIAFAGRWIVVGRGRRPLAAVYVDDVVDSLILAAERDGVLGSTFNVVDTTSPVTQNDYIVACRRMSGSTLRVSHLPESLLMAIAGLADLVSRVARIDLPLSRYRLRSSRPLGPFDCRAARTVLGWTPRVGAQAGLERAGSVHLVPGSDAIDAPARR